MKNNEYTHVDELIKKPNGNEHDSIDIDKESLAPEQKAEDGESGAAATWH